MLHLSRPYAVTLFSCAKNGPAVWLFALIMNSDFDMLKNGRSPEFVIILVVPYMHEEGCRNKVANPVASVTTSAWIRLLKVANGYVRSLGI